MDVEARAIVGSFVLEVDPHSSRCPLLVYRTCPDPQFPRSLIPRVRDVAEEAAEEADLDILDHLARVEVREEAVLEGLLQLYHPHPLESFHCIVRMIILDLLLQVLFSFESYPYAFCLTLEPRIVLYLCLVFGDLG